MVSKKVIYLFVLGKDLKRVKLCTQSSVLETFIFDLLYCLDAKTSGSWNYCLVDTLTLNLSLFWASFNFQVEQIWDRQSNLKKGDNFFSFHFKNIYLTKSDTVNSYLYSYYYFNRGKKEDIFSNLNVRIGGFEM